MYGRETANETNTAWKYKREEENRGKALPKEKLANDEK